MYPKGVFHTAAHRRPFQVARPGTKRFRVVNLQVIVTRVSNYADVGGIARIQSPV